MAKVSIIIPTYNRASYLRQAIDSALNQGIDDLEVVVVDDGSTDDTREVAGQVTDPRVRYVYQPNQGATAAFNRGLRECQGEYVSVLGSDDWYVPRGLLPLAEMLDRDFSLGSASGGYVYVDQDGRPLREEQPWTAFPRLDTATWLFWCPTLLQSSLTRREWIDRIEGFDETVKCVQDWDFGLRLAHAGCPMSWHPRTVFCYRRHPTQISRDARVLRRDLILVLDHFYAQPDVPSELWDLKDLVYANAYVRGALRAFDAGQGDDGREDLERAIRLDSALLDDKGQRLLDQLTAWANSELCGDRQRFTATAFANLPPAASTLTRRRREAASTIEMGLFFDSHQRGNRRAVRSAFLRGILQDPSWLLNRGVLVIAAKAFLDLRVSIIGRSALRSQDL